MHRRGVIAALIAAGFSRLSPAMAARKQVIDLEHSLTVRYKGEVIELSCKDIMDALKSRPIIFDVAPSVADPYPVVLTGDH